MADELQAYCIPRAQIDEAWPGVAKLIEEAYKSSDENVPPDTLAQLRMGHRQLWVVWDGRQVLAAALTRIIVLRSCLACQITACGGHDGDRWINLISRIEEWAKAEGCGKVQVEGRLGWERKLPKYTRARIVLELEL